MDALGYLSYIVPALGEWTDLAWAPLSAFIFYKLFGGKIGNFGSIINFIEELLPFTDFIPTFSISYFIRKFELKKSNKENLKSI